MKGWLNNLSPSLPKFDSKERVSAREFVEGETTKIIAGD